MWSRLKPFEYWEERIAARIINTSHLVAYNAKCFWFDIDLSSREKRVFQWKKAKNRCNSRTLFGAQTETRSMKPMSIHLIRLHTIASFVTLNETMPGEKFVKKRFDLFQKKVSLFHFSVNPTSKYEFEHHDKCGISVNAYIPILKPIRATVIWKQKNGLTTCHLIFSSNDECRGSIFRIPDISHG